VGVYTVTEEYYNWVFGVRDPASQWDGYVWLAKVIDEFTVVADETTKATIVNIKDCNKTTDTNKTIEGGYTIAKAIPFWPWF
jgi:hypothetical protein